MCLQVCVYNVQRHTKTKSLKKQQRTDTDLYGRHDTVYMCTAVIILYSDSVNEMQVYNGE